MVFLQGLEKRGDNNLRKRIYFSAVTPDLYKPMYRAKVTAFFDKLLDQKFADRPFMRHYLDHYFDLYWDLHLGLVGSDIPREVREIGEAFNTVFAYRDPLLPITYHNYMKVRELQDFLKSWIDERISDIQSGKTKNPERTMAWHWLKNAQDGGHFSKKDMVIECLHNFVALGQWGNAIFRVMSLLSEDRGDKAVRASFQKTMSGNFDTAGGASFSPLELFVMELFRVISPNGGSVSTIHDARSSVHGGLRSKSSACRLNGTAMYPRRMPAPAWIRFTGRIQIRSIRNDISASRPARRSTMTNVGKSAWHGVRLTSPISRSRTDERPILQIAASAPYLSLRTNEATQFVTMPALLRSVLDTDDVQVNN